MHRPAPNKAATVTKDWALWCVNSSTSDTTSVKIEEDSEMAWPTSMVLKMSLDIAGFRDIPAVAWAAA